jgi:hypothetical protein
MTANAGYSGTSEREDLRKRSYILTTRDRILGALFVLLAIGAQVLFMGPAIALLCLGLLFAYMFWVTTRWTNNSSKILPIYLLAIFVQCLHFTEEYLTGFQVQYPRLLGYRWSNQQFLIFNVIWLAIFVLAAVGVYRGVRLAYLIVFFLALAGGIGNGVGHIILTLKSWGYFPGAFTAPLCLAVGIALLLKLLNKMLRPLWDRLETGRYDPTEAAEDVAHVQN